MKTKKEIIEETANFYNSKNLSLRYETFGNVTYPTCMYDDPKTGNRCAVGRCMTEDSIKEYGEFMGNVDELTCWGNICLDDILKEEYQGHNLFFWEDIQEFHDTPDYWNDEGLTEEGQKKLNELLKSYED